MKELTDANIEALRRGLGNMEHAIGVVRLFGLTAVVAINRFPEDQPEELDAVKHAALEAGAFAVEESCAFSQGGAGATELAEAVISACQEPSQLKYLYPLEASIQEKVDALARQVYGAGEVRWEDGAQRQARRYTDLGWGTLPICMAKTHLSISADPKMLGRPQGHTFPITDLRIAAGAGFVYPLAGQILTLPGLPKSPNAFKIDVDEKGNVVGLV